MKLKYTFFVLLFSFTFLSAQECQFSLQLADTYGDGWNGASVDIEINGTSTNYTLEFPDNLFAEHLIPASTGDIVTITYNSGDYDEEVVINLVDLNGAPFFSVGPSFDLFAGELFQGPLTCPSCSPTVLSSIETRNIRAYSTQIFWEPLLEEGSTYLIEYGLTGFPSGTGTTISATDSPAFLSGLEADSDYQFLFSGICENGDTINYVDTFAFRTMIPIDLGIVGITQPTSGCGLTFTDSITVQIHNYAGAPQSLIPFNFTINGTPGGVNHPIDGVYTGVLGTDSTDMMEFDMTYDFSAIGEYEIIAWTEMVGDTVPQNDTFSIHIVNYPIISELPYFQTFEGAGFTDWTVQPESQNSSFELGTPSNILINNAVSGNKAWVTNLQGNYSNNEVSYLGSSCFDFSGIAEDPTLDFSFIAITEENYDDLWLEISRDGGASWEKLGDLEPNWYNYVSNNNGSAWGGNLNTNWRTASHVLTNTAGNSEVRIRFVFISDTSAFDEGVGIDNIYIHGAINNDLSVNYASIQEDDLCGQEIAPVVMSIFNHGQMTQSGFDVHYQMNDEAIVTENVGALSISTGGSAGYEFDTAINTSNLVEYSLKVWATFDDENAINDTTTLNISKSNRLPLIETFDNSAPIDWFSTFFWYPAESHANLSANIGANLYDFNPEAFLQTPYYGTVSDGDFLSFEYRYSNFADGTEAYELTDGDFLEVQISTFCNQPYETVMTINADNHVPSTENTKITIDLSAYIGNAVSVRINAASGLSGSDVFLDIDNFLIGNEINTAVTEEEVIVQSLAVMPNPTTGLLKVEYDLLGQTGANLMITNILGKVITTQNIDRVNTGETTVDLSSAPDGIYYLSLVANGQIKTVKVLKVSQ